ncbi:MAG: hypothetical protein AB7F89_08845 [Pirellulaceae bacterium]
MLVGEVTRAIGLDTVGHEYYARKPIAISRHDSRTPAVNATHAISAIVVAPSLMICAI